jgi:hypothetical protein
VGIDYVFGVSDVAVTLLVLTDKYCIAYIFTLVVTDESTCAGIKADMPVSIAGFLFFHASVDLLFVVRQLLLHNSERLYFVYKHITFVWRCLHCNKYTICLDKFCVPFANTCNSML